MAALRACLTVKMLPSMPYVLRRKTSKVTLSVASVNASAIARNGAEGRDGRRAG